MLQLEGLSLLVTTRFVEPLCSAMCAVSCLGSSTWSLRFARTYVSKEEGKGVLV